MMLASIAARKQWTLDEEGDDDEEQTLVDVKPDIKDLEAVNEQEPPVIPSAPIKMEEDEDEEDPLDAFMRGVQDEVRKVNHSGDSGPKSAIHKVVIMKSGVVKKTEKKDKGELIEQNMDGLEVTAILI